MGRTGRGVVTGEILIRRPVGEVFGVVADERNEPSYNPRMRRAEKLTPGPIGAGTRFRAEFASPGRPVATTEITGHEPPRRLASRTRMRAMDIHGELTFDPVPDGTRMRWWWSLEPHGPLRLATPVLARVGGRLERRIWEGLKRLMEAGGPTGAGR